MPEPFGLDTAVIERIRNVLRRYPQVEAAILYGSRAKGQYREGSDIDLSLRGNISFKVLQDIFDDLDELLLPWTIDLSIYDELSNESLKEHIRRVGQRLYSREDPAGERFKPSA